MFKYTNSSIQGLSVTSNRGKTRSTALTCALAPLLISLGACAVEQEEGPSEGETTSPEGAATSTPDAYERASLPDLLDVDGDAALSEAELGEEIPLLPIPASGKYPPNTIVGGSPVTTTSKYPFMTHLSISGPGGSWGCGGSLVGQRWVLTAAHCVVNTSRSGVSLPGDFTARIGGTSLSSFNGETRYVSEVIVHPGYNTQSGANDHDLALLRLSSASTKAPIDLATLTDPGDRNTWRPGANAVTMGFGATCEGCGGSSTLLEVVVPIVDDATMSSAYGSDFNPRLHVGAGYLSGGKDSCQGDSGGPLIVSSNNGYQQVGIVSWGYGCAREGYPGVYTRVGGMALDRWIRTVLHESPSVGDVNGDGKDDLITFTHGDSSAGPLDVYVALSNGSGFGTATKWQDWWAHRGHLPGVGDFNGDGKEDIFAFTDTQVWVALSRGTDFNGAIYASPAGSLSIDEIPRVGDVNGDGKADVVIFKQDGSNDTDVILSTGSGFGARSRWKDYFALDGESPVVCRLGTDKMADIVTFTQGLTDSDVWVAHSTGTAFGTGTKAHDYFGLATERAACGDFNADGKGDVVTFTRNSLRDVWVALGNGSAFAASSMWNGSFGDGNDTMLIGDVNGDKRDDIVRLTQDSAADVYVSLSNGASFGAATLWHGYFAP